jgi:hypothetical protein
MVRSRARAKKSRCLITLNALGKIATLLAWEPISLNYSTPHGFAGQFRK